ncbi:hypothetical protein DFH09DRAFT_1199917 [Mycena vulgaris]|nr:hypothetical protein DFH09DRAFT_1199917 [Mycena vulgaris]
MMRPRYSLIPSSDQSDPRGLPSHSTPSFFGDEDEEELLTRAPPVVYPPDPRFEVPTPPAWQRVALILAILISLAIAVWLQNGYWIGAII